MIQFGGADEQDFRVALHSSGGRESIAIALATIDTERARARVGSDRNHTLAVVERGMGLSAFNEFIREGVRCEYSNINKRHSFRWPVTGGFVEAACSRSRVGGGAMFHRRGRNYHDS